MKQKFT